MNASAQNMVDPSAIQNRSEIWELPRLGKGQKLDLKSIRVPSERLYSVFVYMPTVIGAFILLFLVFEVFEIFLITATIIALLMVLAWIGWKLTMAYILGHSIKVGPTQYPPLHALVNEASEILGIDTPTVFIMRGDGLFEALGSETLFSTRNTHYHFRHA